MHEFENDNNQSSSRRGSRAPSMMVQREQSHASFVANASRKSSLVSRQHPGPTNSVQETDQGSPVTVTRILTNTERKLGTFVSLNLGKLEVKLLEEQQKVLEQEHEQLISMWVTPGKQPGELTTSSHPGLSSPGSRIERQDYQQLQQLSTTSPTTAKKHFVDPLQYRPSVQGSPATNIMTPASTSTSPSALTIHNGNSGIGPPFDSAPSPTGSAYGYRQHQDSVVPKRIVRPDIIVSKSVRLVELVREGQQRIAAQAEAQARAMSNMFDKLGSPRSPKSRKSPRSRQGSPARDAEAARRAFLSSNSFTSFKSYGQPDVEEEDDMAGLHGQALAAQAHVTIDRAERLLQRLRDDLPVDGASDDNEDTELSRVQLDEIQQQLMFLRQASLVRNSEQEPVHPQPQYEMPIFSRRSSKRTAEVWCKSVPEGGMLWNMECSSRRASKRAGISAPRGLMMTFVDALVEQDEFSLVVAARTRLDMMQRFERLVDTTQEKQAPDTAEQQRLGLVIAETILQELQQRLDRSKQALSTPPQPEVPSSSQSARRRTAPGTADAAAAAADGVKSGESRTEGDGSCLAAEGSLVRPLVTETSSSLVPPELRAEFSNRFFVELSNGQILAVPQTPDGAKFSGAYGRFRDFRKRSRHQRAALIQHNPTAFQEEAAESAEAQYRALAERARIRFQTQKQSMHEPRVAEEFLKAVKYLQADRPYFLPPVVVHEGMKRDLKPIAVKVAPEWTVDGSVFEQRKRENESRDVYDTERAKTQQFHLDWQRVVAKVRFRKLVGRSDMGVKMDEQGLDRELGEVRVEMTKYKDQLRSIFIYYSCQNPRMKSDDVLVITMNTWLQFCNEAKVVDNSKKGASIQDMQTVFISVNYEEEKDTQDSEANDDDAMMRFEFHEGVVRAAFGKFIEPGVLDDASDAVSEFMEDIVLRNMPPAALVDPNQFRRNQLYCKDMDIVVTAWLPMIQAMHRLYRAKDHTKYFWIEHWYTLLDSCRLLGTHTGVGKLEVKLIFCWSQMIVSDELRKRKRAVSLSLFDFVEALSRLSDQLNLPDELELEGLLRMTVKSDAAAVTSVRLKRLDNMSISGVSSSSMSGTAGPGNTMSTSGGGSSSEDMWAGYPGKVRDAINVLAKGDMTPGTRGKSLQDVTVAGFIDTCGEGEGEPSSGSGCVNGGIAKGTEPKSRPLHMRFSFLMQYMLSCMRDQWGGKTMEDCCRKMTKMATILSGGIELS